MKKSFKSLIAVLLIFILQFSTPIKVGAQDLSNDEELYNYFKTMLEMVKTKYHGQYDENTVVEGMLKGLFSNFDPYTKYYTNDEADSFFDSMSGEVSGIGVQLSQDTQNVIVSKVIANSPAEKSGIFVGDIIVEVNGKDVTGKDSEEVSQLVRGDKDTQVKLKVNRNGTLKDFDITRAVVLILPGSYKIDNGMGYIKLELFDSNSAQFITDALSYMDSKGIKKIILDLRDNPGGEVEQAVQIASNFVTGDICSLDFKDPSMEDKVYESSLEKSKYKLAVLVNGNSASASEIVTGAVQDSKAGVIIGTKTFGKAKVQTMIPLLSLEAYEKYKKQVGADVVDAYDLITKYGVNPLESEIQGWTKITTGRYKTPNGRMIDLQGIEPDINVQDNSIDAPFTTSEITPLSNESISKNGFSEMDVVTVKKLLVLAGHELSDFSNTMDSNTVSEIKSFQKERSLDVTGQLDASTIDALNNILNLINLMDNRSYNKAVEVLNNK